MYSKFILTLIFILRYLWLAFVAVTRQAVTVSDSLKDFINKAYLATTTYTQIPQNKVNFLNWNDFT